MTIVVGYVRTPEGVAALERAAEEARLRGARVVVVHSSKQVRDRDVEDMLSIRDELDRAQERLREAGVDFEVHHLVRNREPADDVIEMAANTGAELIVIGLRRRSPTGKLLLGSTAQEILLGAGCPVLAVKAHG